MKKIFIILGLIAFTLNLQSASGNINLAGKTLTAIDGTVYDLQQLQNDDVIIVFNFWATFLAPVFNFPTLEVIWDESGSLGDQTYMIFSIEKDYNSTNELFTISQYPYTINHPVVIGSPSTSIQATDFNVGLGYPYTVVVCPDGTWRDKGGILSNPNQLTILGDSCNITSSVVNDGRITGLNLDNCPLQSALISSFDLKNIGTNNLTSANIEIQVDGVAFDTINWTGNLITGNTEEVLTNTIPFNGIGTQNITATILDVNGTSDENPLNNSLSGIKEFIVSETLDIELELIIDGFPEEMGYNIRNEAGNVIFSEAAGYFNGYPSNPFINITLPNWEECYTIELTDSYGDGSGGFRVRDDFNNILIENTTYFTTLLSSKLSTSQDDDNDTYYNIIENIAGSNPNDLSSTPINIIGCPSPINLATLNISPASALLTWESSDINFNIEYGPTGFTPGWGTTVQSSDDSLYIFNLNDNTTYQWYVNTICGSVNSNVIGPESFTTSNITTCITPTFTTETNLTATSVDLSWTSSGTSFVVEYGPAGFNFGTGTAIYTSSNSISLTGLNSNANYGWYVINICGNNYSLPTNQNYFFTTNPSPCLAPSNLVTSNISTTSAQVSWSSSEPDFLVEYGPTGFTLGNGTTLNSSTNNITLSGLTLGTTYDWYVLSDCGSSSSNYTGPSSFTTISNPNPCNIPTNLATSGITSTSANISWNSSEPNFVVEYGPTGFTIGNGTSINTSNTNSSITGLTTGNTYDWYVLSNCGSTSSNYAGPLSFTATANPNPCNSPTNLSTSGITNTGANISWTSSETNFNIEYGPSGFTLGNGTTINTSSTNSILSGLLANTSYQWYVTSICSSGNSNPAGPQNFNTNNPSSGCNSPLNQTSINLTASSADLSWSSTETSFRIEYGPVGFTLGTGTQIQSSSNPYTLSGLVSNTSYHWYVSNICGANVSNPLGPEIFTTACESPTGLASTVTGTNSADLSWSSNDNTFIIEYGPVGFIPGTGTQIQTTTSPYSLTGLVLNTEYNWYLSSSCSNTNSSTNIGPKLFKTNNFNSINDLANKMSISLFPNPALDIINLNIKSEIKAEFKYELINIYGALVNVIESTDELISFETKQLNSGIYLIKISLNGETVEMKRFVKM